MPFYYRNQEKENGSYIKVWIFLLFLVFLLLLFRFLIVTYNWEFNTSDPGLHFGTNTEFIFLPTREKVEDIQRQKNAGVRTLLF